MKSEKDYGLLLRTLAQKIQFLRKERGFTQEKMADFGFNYRHYQKIESGTYSPSLRTLHRVAQALGVKISDLLP